MDALKEYQRWEEHADCGMLSELVEIGNSDTQIKDRFGRHLEFGTGGLRGVLGVGTNRMNIYTVGRATQGLADYLRGLSPEMSVCIAYDTRHMSREFAEAAALICCANGIRVFMFEDIRPTPVLAFATRYLKAGAGIMITASHNPKEYNGYKVYGSYGGQITDKDANAILARINACDIFASVRTMPLDEAKASGLLTMIGEDVDAPYYGNVKKLVLRRELVDLTADSLKILYSPIHGTGNIPVRRVLSELGFSDVTVVPQQEKPDGDFPTVHSPNPEEPEVFAHALKMAETIEPDLIMATDPDCDRIGILARDDAGAYTALTGNQIGVLLCDYILAAKQESKALPDNAAIIKTIVTTDLAKPVCDYYGVDLVDTLTGFKYIGEKADIWEKTGERSFQFGFEESYGYLAGDFVRDKDAVIASVLIAEMTLYYKTRGISLSHALEAIYKRFYCTAEKAISITMPGAEGQHKIASIISELRENYRVILKQENIAIFEDYMQSVRIYADTGRREGINLPESNVLKFIFDDGSWLTIRPSGTEPKIKVYLMGKGENRNATARLRELELLAKSILTGK